MKKIVIFLIMTTSLFAAITINMKVTGAGSPIANGIYLTSDPDTRDGVYYYTKVGTPTLYLFRWHNTTTLRRFWIIGTVLGDGNGHNHYYYGEHSTDTPNGALLGTTGALGTPPYPTPNDTALPVELSFFTVETVDQGVLCEWTTESEIENLGFILERKTQGTDWEEIVSYKSDRTLMGQGTISSPTDYEYIDKLVEPNTIYDYRLADVDLNGVVTYHSTRTVTVNKAPISSTVEEFTVQPAYPNPFNPSTTIRYGLDNDSKVTIAIYDIAGKLITTLVNTEQTQGWHSVIWNGTNQLGELAPAGQYFTKITSNNKTKTTKLMLLK